MQFIPLGGPALKIISKTNLAKEGEIVIVINPFGAVKGLAKLRKQKAHIVIASKKSVEYYDEKNHDADTFVISSPGEYEIMGVLFGCSYVGDEKNRTLVFRIDIENVALGFCIGLELVDMDALVKTLEGIDVLFVSVGGKDVLDAKKAMDIVTALEPRMVIPMQYKTKSSPTAHESVAGFVKEFGGNAPMQSSKLKLTKKELPSTDRQLFLLE